MSIALPSRPSGDSLPRVAWLLAAAGTLPFMAGVVAAVAFDGRWLGAVQIYGAVIAAFVGGIHWAAAMPRRDRTGLLILVASNVSALAAWGAALAPAGPGFLGLAVVFAVLLAIDHRLARSGTWPDWFWRLRATISAVVIAASLAISAAVAMAGGA